MQNKRMDRVLIVDRKGITGGRVDLGKVRNQSLLLEVHVDLQIWKPLGEQMFSSNSLWQNVTWRLNE